MSAGPGASRIPAVLDCDPGHDDAVAIAVALHRLDLVGITTVAGNVGLPLTTRNALGVLQVLGADVPVHSGAAGPLVGEPIDAVHVHGETGLAGAALPELDRDVASDDAVGFLVDASRAHAGLWVIAVGPLTNVALALQRDPGFAGRLAGISIMGGGTYGNVTAAAEFNIHADPEAAAAVVRCGAPIRMCGLDLTHQLLVDDDVVGRLRASRGRFGRLAADFLGAYLVNVRQLAGGAGLAALHDPCAVLAVSDPELFELEDLPVDVETRGEHTRGMTVVDRRGRVRPANVSWAAHVDARRALDLIVEASTR